MWLTLLLLFLGYAPAARADTACPEALDGVSIVNVQVSGAPDQVAFATYDLKTSFLTVTFTARYSQMFIGVPRGAVPANGKVQWTALLRYPQAVMQEPGTVGSTCPLLQEGRTNPVLPIQIER